MRGGQRLGDVGAGAKAGIDQALFPQPTQGLTVKRGALGLDDRLTVPADAEPFEVLENAVDKFRPAAAGVEILDPEAELAAARPGLDMAQNGRIGMPEVEAARRRRGETCDLQDSLHDKGDSGDS